VAAKLAVLILPHHPSGGITHLGYAQGWPSVVLALAVLCFVDKLGQQVGNELGSIVDRDSSGTASLRDRPDGASRAQPANL
jgi:hypothetical protein